MYIKFPWCSGYHICLTRRWSPVRSRAETFFLFNLKKKKLCVLDVLDAELDVQFYIRKKIKKNTFLQFN